MENAREFLRIEFKRRIAKYQKQLGKGVNDLAETLADFVLTVHLATAQKVNISAETFRQLQDLQGKFGADDLETTLMLCVERRWNSEGGHDLRIPQEDLPTLASLKGIMPNAKMADRDW